MHDYENKTIYKIPVGSRYVEQPMRINNTDVHICMNTGYTSTNLTVDNYNIEKTKSLFNKFITYKPVYFDRFKYVGKGFKMILKKKRNMFNCIFGHSHIYWVKLQNTMIKKTKKYKYMFVANDLTMHKNMINILKKIKPINRYTLRGVRTYTHVWIKRKGRKSVATHV